MNIFIHGNHTSPNDDFPYDKASEFERSLKNEWDAIQFFQFNTNNGADIRIDIDKTANMTVRDVHMKLLEAVMKAGREIDWRIWTVFLPRFDA